MADTQAENTTSNAGGNENNQAATQQQGDQGKEKLQFNADQVGWINKHSDEMYGKGISKAKAEFEPKLTAAEAKVKELETELEKLRSGAPSGQAADDGKATGGKGKAKSEEPSEDVKRLSAKVEELTTNMATLLQQNKAAEDALNKERETNRRSRIKDEFMSAAATLNFFDANDVFKLVEGEIGFDDKHGVIVKNEKTGEPRMTVGGGEYRPVTLAEFLSEFAQKKPAYVKAAASDGGSGSGGSQRLPMERQSDLPDFSKMSPAEVAAYAAQLKTRPRE